MKEMVQKLARAEQEMAAEKGQFFLFALFLREDAPDVWDLLVASNWITRDKPGSLRYISERLRAALDPDELLRLSRVVLIEPDNPALAALQKTVRMEHKVMEIKDRNLLGLQVKHAYVITSRREANTGSHGSIKQTG